MCLSEVLDHHKHPEELQCAYSNIFQAELIPLKYIWCFDDSSGEQLSPDLMTA